MAEEVTERVLEQLYQFSGPVPPAEELYKYEPEHAERLIRMAESRSTDESARRDRMIAMQEKVTDANILVASRGQWINAVFVGSCIAATIVTYGLWENLLLSALFLAAPAVRLVGSTVVASVRRRRTEEPSDGDD